MRLTFRHWRHYLQLIRFDRPIGTFLVMWPALWSLWLAPKGPPSFKNLFIFVFGAFLMRSAGCIINDYADRNIDQYVQRTRTRPLARKSISNKEAIELFFLFILFAFILVLFTNFLTIKLAFVGLVLAIIYPFMKRFTHLPQIVLGLAFSFPVPMAWAAEIMEIPAPAWWLYAGAFFWIVGYDTYYAMVDKRDDLAIGVKSTAVLFGKQVKKMIAICNLLSLGCFLTAGIMLRMGSYFYTSLVIVAGLFIFQQHITRNKTPESCLRAFLHNNWVGAVIFTGILASLIK